MFAIVFIVSLAITALMLLSGGVAAVVTNTRLADKGVKSELLRAIASIGMAIAVSSVIREVLFGLACAVFKPVFDSVEA